MKQMKTGFCSPLKPKKRRRKVMILCLLAVVILGILYLYWGNTSKMCIRDRKYEAVLGDEGRILVRASGTEPLIRVMIEGKDQEEITKYAKHIADVIKQKLC